MNIQDIKVKYTVPQSVISDTRQFLQEKGQTGCEGALLWIGCRSDNGFAITRSLFPGQTCIKSPYGLAVELTERAHYTLTDSLSSDERLLVRVHSHPAEAYHSERDDQNGVLTHQGALSIVVPYFAADPIALSACAVYRLQHGAGWTPLTIDEIAETFEVAP